MSPIKTMNFITILGNNKLSRMSRDPKTAGCGLLSHGLGVRGKMRRPPKNPILDPRHC